MACCALFIFVIAQWVMLWRRFRAALGRFRLVLAAALVVVVGQGVALAANWTAVEESVHEAVTVALSPAVDSNVLPADVVLCGEQPPGREG